MNGIGGIVPLSTLVSCIANMVCFAFLIKSETPLAELCSHSCKVSRCTPNQVDKEATVGVKRSVKQNSKKYPISSANPSRSYNAPSLRV